MPRSSRHRSHRSHRRGRLVERSESEGEEAGGAGLREEPALVAARVSRDPEPERRRSSSGKEVVSSGNGFADHGRKRKDRVEEMVVDVVSDRWNSGVCEDHLVEKTSKSEVFGPVDMEKLAEKSKGSGDESKRSSRQLVGLEESVDEGVSKSDSGKRRSAKEKDLGRRESSGQYKDDRDRERERDREKEREREREKEWERLKERERERGRDTERDREREKEREREREREKERDRERDREKEHERQKDRERDKKDYDSKHERYEDGSTRKNGTKTSRVEEGYSYKREIEINETPVKEKYSNPDKEPDKHSRRKVDSEDKDKWPTDNTDSDDRKNLSRHDHGKVRSSKEQKFDDDKYKERYKDGYERGKRQQDDKCLDERLSRDHESDRAGYKNAKDGHRASESHYRKDIAQDGDHYDDYGSRYKENRGRKRPPEENDDQYDLKPPSARERGNLEKSSGSGRLDSLIERARSDHRHPQNVDSSPSKIHARSSPSPSPYHDKDQSWHRSKLADHTNREIPYDERNIRPRTSSGTERTPASRQRDRDADNWSSERLKQKDDLQSCGIPLEISTSSQYDRTPRKDTHPSPKQLSEKSPSSDQRFSGRLSGGRSLDYKGERSSLTKYRDRDGDLSLDRSLHQDRRPAKAPYREPTPSASSISRGGHFSGTSPNHPLPPPSRHRSEDSSFLGSHDDDRRPQSGDRRFHGHQKRNDMNSGRGHGHAWNNPPSWPSPVANGFVPMQHGAPGFHPPVHQFPAPPMFNLRPQMKLNQPGVSYSMHDAVDRFSTHMRPFGWPNPLDESCPPHVQVWNGGNGVFAGEPYMYGRQEWDQNRPLAGNRGWEATGDALKGQNELPDTELPVAKKEPDCLATPVSESSGGQYNLNPHAERKEMDHLTSEKTEAKDDAKRAVRNLEAPQGALLRASMLSSNGTAVFSKNYLSRISVSHDLVESELYERCISLLGDLGIPKAPQVVRNGLIQNIGNIGKLTRKHGISNLLSSLYLKNNSVIYQRAMVLHKNQTEKAVAPTQVFVQTEGKMDLPEDNHDDTKMLDHTPRKELSVTNPAPHHCADIMEEGPPLKQEPGDGTGVTPQATTESGDVEAPPAITGPPDEDMEAPPAITGPDEDMEAPPAITGPDEDMEVVAPPAITVPDKDMEDVAPPAIAVAADGLVDGAPDVIVEHADGSQEAPPAIGESSDGMDVMPPAVTEQPGQGKEDSAAVASPDGQETVSIIDAGVEKGMKGETDKVIDGNPGDGEVNSSSFVSELDVVASGAQDCETLLVESRVNLSRIPNSPESTH